MPLDTALRAPSATRQRRAAARPRAELPATSGPVRLDFLHPLTRELVCVSGPEGSTIAELLAIAGINHRRWGDGFCWIEDAGRSGEPVVIDRGKLHRVRPKAGTITTVSLWPGQGGGGGGKNILRVVLAIAVVVAAAFIGPEVLGLLAPQLIGTTAGAAIAAGITAAVSIVGNLIINALIPPPRPRTNDERIAGLAEDRSGFYLQGTQNQARPYAPVPLHLGRLRRFADLGAEFYTEIVGNDQFLRFFMPWGLGPLKVSELKIGETPIAEFEGIETRTVEGWPDDGPPEIFTDDPHTEGLSIDLTPAGGWQTRETVDDIDEFQVEIAMPEGMGIVRENGALSPLTYVFSAEMAPTGTEDWAAIAWANSSEAGFETPGTITITDATRTGQPRRVGRCKPSAEAVAANPSKQWRVRLRRLTEESINEKFGRSYWSSLVSIKYTLPLGPRMIGRLAYTEGRIKATGQLNGVISQLNALVESYVREFDEDGFVGAWDVPRTNWIVSRNNAELFAHVLGHWSALRAVPASRINWLNLVEWRDACAAAAQDGAPKWLYDRVWESGATLGGIADEIASAGRARRGMPGGKHGVVRDLPQSVPVQHFTPRNSSGFKVDITFRRRLHAIRVRYNKDGLGQEAELTIYDDGYDESNATEFETAEAIGYTREAQVWRDFRYWLAVQRLRPHEYSLGQDVEFLKAGRGALVRATHDVVGWGLGSGRLRSVTLDENEDFAGIALDTKVTMEAGKSYGIRFRNANGSFYAGVATEAGERSSLSFVVAQPASWGLAAGDLFGFGEAGKESVELVVTGVAPAANLNATLKLVDAAPAVHDADTGTIPAFDPQSTRPPADARDPAEPVIRNVKSDESVLVQRVGGALVVRILVELGPTAGLPAPDFVQARWRPSEASPWTVGSMQPAAGLSYAIEAVTQGIEYTVEIRNVTAAGRASNWKRFTHLVIGKTTPPPAVAALFLGADHLIWPYADPPLDVTHGGGFRFRYHYGASTDWDSAIAAHDDLLADPRFPVSLLPPGELTLLVKAVDADGNESATAARLFTEILPPDVVNILAEYDYVAAGFPGEIAGAAVDGEDALAALGQDQFWEPGDAAFWLPDDEDFWADEFAELDYRFRYSPGAGLLPARLTFETLIEGTPRRFDYWARNNPAETFWADDGKTFYADDGEEFWGGGQWRAWPGAIDLSVYGHHDFRIRAGGGDSQGKIVTLIARLDVEDVRENLHNVAIAPGGTALPVTKTYQQFLYVIPVLRDDGGDARGVRVVTDLPSASVPVIECLDAAGASCAGHVDILPVHGY